jgi:tetratricopeptide (TPR) repeat protein
MIERISLIFVLCLISAASFGQTDVELAEYYYNNGEYEQAKLYYEKIYKSNKTNKVYTNYLNTLVALGNFEGAEKVVKKKLKAKGNNANAYVDLGELYKKFGKHDEANSQFEEAVSELIPGRSHSVRLANAFIKLSEYDFARRTYEKGRRIANDGYEFHYEMANLQGMMGNHEAMAESFLDLLMTSPNYIQTVQNSFNRNLNITENEENADMLRQKLLKRVQRFPDVTIYNELLVWLFLQKKDFGSALVQARALDMRLEENGFRMIDIAQLAMNNKDYTTARQAYTHVISKGDMHEYYTTARMELLQVMLEEVTEKPSYEQLDMTELETTYESTLGELGKTTSTAMMMKELAHIKGFYLGKHDEAVALLEEAIEIQGLYDKIEAVLKLELGDLLLLDGNIWEASLLYSQVELDFKEDLMGHEAKFRNAKIAYYTGDFEWAQGQLDVLKASTSKLISNDAIDLSLLITDNYNMDTTVVPMLMYAQADLLSYQNQVDMALMKVDSITELWPGHALTDNILMLKAELFIEQADYDTAVVFLNEIMDLHFHDILADDALFMLAEINHYVYKELDSAQGMYEQIMVEYPGSLYVIEARKRFRALRGDEIN